MLWTGMAERCGQRARGGVCTEADTPIIQERGVQTSQKKRNSIYEGSEACKITFCQRIAEVLGAPEMWGLIKGKRYEQQAAGAQESFPGQCSDMCASPSRRPSRDYLGVSTQKRRSAKGLPGRQGWSGGFGVG